MRDRRLLQEVHLCLAKVQLCRQQVIGGLEKKGSFCSFDSVLAVVLHDPLVSCFEGVSPAQEMCAPSDMD